MVDWDSLNQRIVECSRCPRLRDHCREVARTKRRAYMNDTYWGRPVPNFGDPRARLLVVGLAPGAHGANRTGRMFTGDRSGDWLFRALHRAGFASQPDSSAINDGLHLHDCAITAACHCAPPANKPAREELELCREWFDLTVSVLPVRVFLALGAIGWKMVAEWARANELLSGKIPAFGHGADVTLTDGRHLIGSYHPSQQNTFTGRLTERMLDHVLSETAEILQRAAEG